MTRPDPNGCRPPMNGNLVAHHTSHALPGCALRRPNDAEVVMSSTSHQREASGWEVRTAATTS